MTDMEKKVMIRLCAKIVADTDLYKTDKEQKYQQLETVHLSKGQKLNRLKELSKLYALFAPIQATYKESRSLKGLEK